MHSLWCRPALTLEEVMLFMYQWKVKLKKTFTNSEDCVRAAAIDICEQYTFAPFMAVLSLCNVIKSPIYLFTRILSDKCLMSLFNNKIKLEQTTGISIKNILDELIHWWFSIRPLRPITLWRFVYLPNH